MSLQVICGAINSRNVIRFYYTGTKAPGYRLVEPHMVAYNRKNNLALSGWFLGGESESQEGQGWREYLMDEIAQVTVTPTRFAAPRPGYAPDGGKTFHNVQCAV
jgi:hypothetical protein